MSEVLLYNEVITRYNFTFHIQINKIIYLISALYEYIVTTIVTNIVTNSEYYLYIYSIHILRGITTFAGLHVNRYENV